MLMPKSQSVLGGTSSWTEAFLAHPTLALAFLPTMELLQATPAHTPLHNPPLPAIRSSGDHIGMAGDALVPNPREVLNDDASTHVQEDGSVSSTQSQGSAPVPTTTTNTTHTPTDAHDNPITYAPNMEVATGERPEEITEEVIPVCNESVEEHRLAVITQQLLKMVEAAVNPAQGTHFQLISVGVNVKECLLPGDKGAQLAMLNIHAFLISVDVFQQEGKFPAAMTLMAKVGYVFVGSQSAITWEGGFAYALAS